MFLCASHLLWISARNLTEDNQASILDHNLCIEERVVHKKLVIIHSRVIEEEENIYETCPSDVCVIKAINYWTFQYGITLKGEAILNIYLSIYSIYSAMYGLAKLYVNPIDMSFCWFYGLIRPPTNVIFLNMLDEIN